MENLVKKINEIEMPKDMQERMIRKCYQEMEEKIMNKNRTKRIFKKPVVAVASLALCICLTGVTGLAAAGGKLEGFFKDIVGWNGAVTGTSYEQATEEVEFQVLVVSQELAVEITMLQPETAPYNSLEQVGIKSYKIIDEDGNIVIEGKETASEKVVNGTVKIGIVMDDISQGKYKLYVSELVGSAKAEQPLVLSGNWECEFTK